MAIKAGIISGFILFAVLYGTAPAAGLLDGELMFHPMNQGGGGHQHGQSSGRPGGKAYMLMNGKNSIMRMWKPDGEPVTIKISGDYFDLPKTGVDNYHAVVVDRKLEGVQDSYVRYIYRRGKPAGHSPAELLAISKSTLEVVPDPLPREHQRYQSGETWPFMVRFKGEPLANVEVALKTAHGNGSDAVSDKEGRVRLHIPDDFFDVVEWERDKRRADFAVTVEHQDGAMRYRSHLGAQYELNPMHWRSTTLGVLVIGIGMLAGAFLGRVRGRDSREAG